MAAQFVAYGKIESMVAEYGACEMPKDWLKQHAYRYCAKIVGDEDYDTEFCKTLKDARETARYAANNLGVKVHSL